MAPPPKKSQGRRKIEMKLITDENARTVTFSKRRAGLFKKATELSVLCGTQIALIIFSLGGRAYSFGHPDVQSIIRRFSNRNPVPNPQESAYSVRIRSAVLKGIKQQYDQKSEELRMKKKRGKEIEAALESLPCYAMEESLDGLDLQELQQLKERMEKLREQLQMLANARVESPPDLKNVGKTERGASPIPADWLKL